MLISEGHAVTAVARDAERLEASCEKLRGDGGDVTALVGDVSAVDAADRIVDTHLDRYGSLDVVVANAGTGTNASVARTDRGHVDAIVGVNVNALFDLARSAVPALRREDRQAGRGWFIVVSSMSGLWPTPGFAVYSATKAMGVSLARSVAAEEAQHGVRACAICPGFVDTELSKWVQGRVPVTEMIRPDDVAEAVRMLLRLSPSTVVTELALSRVGAPPYTP
jgi:NAD(P)-dependent dehydrogenase (short-subunit alcohol dehydrogenase family)